ncbi:MAG TPA: DUF3857 domain-containing protein [Gemmatimonadaceae bacterium]
MNPQLLVAAVVWAVQTPVIQAQPAVLRDSIYGLAVDSAKYPDDAVVWLLDEGVYRIEPDGRSQRTIRQVVQILKPQGAQQYRERRFTYDPAHERLTVHWVRVVKPNGEVISAEPSQVQESDVPAPMGTPVYVNTKVKRMSLSGLEPGTILDYSFTTEETKPFMPGEFLFGWTVTPAVPVVRSNLVVDVPVGFKPRIVERNLDFKRRESVSNGRRMYAWTTPKVPRVKPERFVPDSLIPVMRVTISPPHDWAAIGRWYAPIAKDAYAIGPLAAQKITTVLAGARSLDDSIRALHKWVAQDIRYVAITLGSGGYVPRSADSVVRTGFGDCKDKSMLFLAALRKIGVKGYPVLLNINGGEQKESPALGQFNHMIAAVERGNAYQFADLTAETYPVGKLPRSEEGNLAVLVKEQDAEEITLPESPLGKMTTTVLGQLSTDGVFTGTLEQAVSGELEMSLRSLLQIPLDSAQRQRFARGIARSYFEAADADSLQSFDAKDFTAPARLKVRITRAQAVTRAGDVQLLANPLQPNTFYARLAEDLGDDPPRKYPIETSRILSSGETRSIITIKLPQGWRALLPKNVVLNGPVGNYSLTYAQTGDELRIERAVSGIKQVLPASRMPDVIGWLKAAGSDDGKLIVLQPPPGKRTTP